MGGYREGDLYINGKARPRRFEGRTALRTTDPNPTNPNMGQEDWSDPQWQHLRTEARWVHRCTTVVLAAQRKSRRAQRNMGGGQGDQTDKPAHNDRKGHWKYALGV